MKIKNKILIFIFVTLLIVSIETVEADGNILAQGIEEQITVNGSSQYDPVIYKNIIQFYQLFILYLHPLPT